MSYRPSAALRSLLRRAGLSLLSVALLSVLTSAAIADPTPQSGGFAPQATTRVEGSFAAVVVNGRVSLTLRTEADGLSPADRAQAIAGRIAGLAGAAALTVTNINKRSVAIETASGRLIAVVTKADAEAQASALGPLAHRWADAISAALAIPPIRVSLPGRPSPVGYLIVPTGQSRDLIVGGAAPPQAVGVQDSSRAVARSTFDPLTHRLSVQGVSAGREQVTVSASDGQGGQAARPVEVIVEDPAASIAPVGGGRVTGAPSAPRSLVIQAVFNALYRMIAAHDGAQLELLESPDITQDLPAGQSVTVAVPIRVSGEGLVSVDANPQVTITNDDTLSPLTAADLFYSNDPEEVKGPQPLFCASLGGSSRPARLVYHHVNVSGGPLVLRIEVLNLGDRDATLDMVQGRAGPAEDPVEAGYKAGIEFLTNLQDNDGIVLGLPAGSRLTLMEGRLPAGDTDSGYIQIAQIGAQTSHLLLRVSAEPAGPAADSPLEPLVTPINYEAGAYPVQPIDATLAAQARASADSDQVYASPEVALAGSYVVGRRWLYMDLGTKHAISRMDDRKARLAGNYGVVYDLDITLANPGKEPRIVTLVFEPQAGPAAGLFLLDNMQWVQIGPTEANDDHEIERVPLDAGQSRSLEIETMPLSGSAYPVSLIAHALSTGDFPQ